MIKTIVHSTCNLCGYPAEFFDNGNYPVHKHRPYTTAKLCVTDRIFELSDQKDKEVQVCHSCYDKLQGLCKKVGVTTQPDDRTISLFFDEDEEVYYIPVTDLISIISTLYHLTPAQTEDSMDDVMFAGD